MRKLLLVVFALVIAVQSPGAEQSSDREELKAMVKAMQKTIAAQNARIATLETHQATPKSMDAGKPAPSGRSVNVTGMDVPVAELPDNAMSKSSTPVRDAESADPPRTWILSSSSNFLLS